MFKFHHRVNKLTYLFLYLYIVKVSYMCQELDIKIRESMENYFAFMERNKYLIKKEQPLNCNIEEKRYKYIKQKKLFLVAWPMCNV